MEQTGIDFNAILAWIGANPVTAMVIVAVLVVLFGPARIWGLVTRLTGKGGPPAAVLLAAILAGCAPAPVDPTLTPEEQAERAAAEAERRKQAAIEFALGRLNTAMALGIIDTNITGVSTGKLFVADTACAGLRIVMLRYPGEVIVPVGQGPFCSLVQGEILRRATLPPDA